MPSKVPREKRENLGLLPLAKLSYSAQKYLDLGQNVHKLLESHGHKFPYGTGPFYQVSTYSELAARTSFVSFRNSANQTCEGTAALMGTAIGSIPFINLPTYAQASSYVRPYGPTGWNRTRPTKPVAALAQSVGEVLKDGLPKVPGSQLVSALRRLPVWAALSASGVKLGSPSSSRDVRRALGSEYLNWDFGWRPMISDALALCNASAAIHERIRRWRQAGNGGTIRRRITLKDESSSTSVPSYSPNELSMGNVGYTMGTWNGYTERGSSRHDRIWYVAAYKLNIPDLDGISDNPSVIRALLGASLTPELAWELTPWSWMVDWFSNIGDVLANLSDPLRHYYAATHACVMHQREEINSYSLHANLVSQVGPGNYITSAEPRTLHLEARRRGVAKLRWMASPFGFGVTWDQLSLSQLATAAALGISRA